MLRITRASLVATTLFAAIALQPVASLADEAQQAAPAAPAKSGCQMAECADCAAGGGCCAGCQAMAEHSGGKAPADCPCKHAKHKAKKAKRKAAASTETKPQQ